MMYKKVRNSGQVANETTIKTTGQRYDQLLIILQPLTMSKVHSIYM